MTLVDEHGAVRATVPCAACDRPVRWDLAHRLEGSDGRTVHLCAGCDPDHQRAPKRIGTVP